MDKDVNLRPFYLARILFMMNMQRRQHYRRMMSNNNIHMEYYLRV